MDRISTESIKKNWARVGSRRYHSTAASSGRLELGSTAQSVKEHRTLKDVIDPTLYVDYMDLKMKQKLGEGAFAKVFQATYLVDGREVAVKMLRDEHLLHLSEVFMFLKEFKTIKHLRWVLDSTCVRSRFVLRGSRPDSLTHASRFCIAHRSSARHPSIVQIVGIGGVQVCGVRESLFPS